MFTPLVLFVTCVVLNGAQMDTDIPECNKPNEVLSHCVKPCGGEDSCYDHYQHVCAAVVQPCIPACVCKEGFIRKTLDLECIPKEECGSPCELYTQYSECRHIYKETCSSIMNPSKTNDNAEACTPGCTCWDGYYRANETEPCVHRCSCPGMQDSPDCESYRTIYS